MRKINGTNYFITEDGEVLLYGVKPVNQFKDTKGYSKVSIRFHGKAIQCYVHRLVANAYIPKPPNISEADLCVRHKDLNKENNSVDNLEWGTFSQIVNECHERGVYDQHLKSLKKAVIMEDRLNCSEIEFESLIQAAIYLKSIKDDLPEESAVRANISMVLNNPDRTAYGYYWKEKKDV